MVHGGQEAPIALDLHVPTVLLHKLVLNDVQCPRPSATSMANTVCLRLSLGASCSATIDKICDMVILYTSPCFLPVRA